VNAVFAQATLDELTPLPVAQITVSLSSKQVCSLFVLDKI
jgi:hypothetical protein